MSQLDASELISQWRSEYPIVGPITWDGYEDLGASTLGVTRYPAGDNPHIALHNALRYHPIWAKSVLWHEFCHAAADYEYGHTVAHGSKWRQWMRKKPILALINMFAPEPGVFY